MQQYTLRTKLMMACAISVGLSGAAFAQSTTAELDAAYAADGLLPPEAKPGECYAIPAVFKTETTTVELEPEKEVEEIIPAVYEEVVERVKIREAYKTWKKGEGPIQKYDEATGRKLVTPAKVDRIEIPARYETVYETVKATPGKMEWRPILCSTNVSEDIISRLQIALRDKGFNVGVIDGVLGAGTMNAVKRYQKDNGLAEGQITIETLKSLDVTIR